MARALAPARAAGAVSTISPAYMIAMRSANSSSSERSCVMKRTAKPKSLLQRLDLLEDLPLDDDVEGRRRLVHDDQLRLQRERHGDDHALAHPAGELVRVRAEALRGRCRRGRARSAARASAFRFEIFSCARIMSTNWSPTRITGLSAFIALWKTIETLRQRNRRSSFSLLADQVLAAEEDAAAGDVAGRAEDLHHRARDGRLAAAGLAGEPEDLAGADRRGRCRRLRGSEAPRSRTRPRARAARAASRCASARVRARARP